MLQELNDKIKEEQKEFLDFAKSKWNSNLDWNIKCIKFVAMKWKAKMSRLPKLPNEYIEMINIPLAVAETFVLGKSIKINFIRCLKKVRVIILLLVIYLLDSHSVHANLIILFIYVFVISRAVLRM